MSGRHSSSRNDSATSTTRASTTQRLARASARHPWRVLVAWLLLVAASFVAIGALLGSALTTDATITTRPDSVKADDLISRSFPQRTTFDESVIVHAPGLTVDDPRFRSFVSDLRSTLTATGATRTVSNPYTTPGGAAFSVDRHAAAVTLVLGKDPDTGIDGIIDEVTASDAAPGFDVDISGTYTLNHDFNALSQSDLKKGELTFGLPAALIVLLLVFGAVVAATIPMTVALLSIVVAVAASSLVGQVTQLSFFIVNMITAMGLALGIDYSLFVLSRYREERLAGRDKLDAIGTTGATASKAVLFSGSSFVVALLGLLLVPDTTLRSLALGAIIVGLVTMVAALTLLPALLSLLGDRVNALRLPFVGRRPTAESPFWTRAVTAVVRHPAAALAGGVLVLLVAASPVVDLSTGTAGVSTLPDSSHAKQGFLAAERSFPRSAGSDPALVVVPGDVASPAVISGVDRLQTALRDDARFGRPQVRTSPNGQVTLLSVPLVGDPDNSTARSAVRDLRADLVPAAFTGVTGHVLVGGTTAGNMDYSTLINRWLPVVLVFVLGLSFLLLTVVFRSVVVSATAVALNLLSVGAAYGVLVLVFEKGFATHLLGFERVQRVEAWVPVFLFSVLFALSMDYHVFLLTRIRERHVRSGDTVDAVVHGIASTGRIITGAALIIVVVFAGFAAGQLVMFQQMGFGVAVALLVDATLIRMVIVPAAMTL
ncbi:MAG: putative drug exporter of the superfamily, partial [Nocardioidaceae bacterium]|nr:putative drug exporter of the superfamily [Nocardioidaceae bacterium]